MDNKSWTRLSQAAIVDDESRRSAGGRRVGVWRAGGRAVGTSFPPYRSVCLGDKADGHKYRFSSYFFGRYFGADKPSGRKEWS